MRRRRWTLIDLAGSIALLLWGVHMVQTGIQHAFGAGLRRELGVALGSRFRAYLAGLATGLMASSLAASGLVDPVPARAAMLGASAGTTLIVQVLSFDVSRVAPLGLLAGVTMCAGSGVLAT